MFTDISRSTLVGFWFTAVAVIVASAMAAGLSVGISTTAVLLTLSLVPPAILVFVWRGAPPPTIAEVLYVANTHKGGRP